MLGAHSVDVLAQSAVFWDGISQEFDKKNRVFEAGRGVDCGGGR
jgi:hypothetical protein